MRSPRRSSILEIALFMIIPLAVLAAIFLFRLFTQTEKTYMTEANLMLGSLACTQGSQMRLKKDLTGGFIIAKCGGATPCPEGSASALTWQAVGLRPPPSSFKFSYECDAATCTASRTVNAIPSTIVFNYMTRSYRCGGIYSIADDINEGCIIR